MNQNILKALAVCLLIMGSSCRSMADYETTDGTDMAQKIAMPKETPKAKKDHNPTDDNAMMEHMKEYATPNENHQILAKLAGEWTATVKMWMDPKEAPTVSQGSSVSRMIMDGRFLQQDFKGDFMGQAFEGQGLWGYDNILKEFRSIWYDNMATGIMVAHGKYNAAKKTITDEGKMSCPLTNNERWMKTVTHIIDDDHYTYESYLKDEKTGKVVRTMEISYSRKK